MVRAAQRQGRLGVVLDGGHDPVRRSWVMMSQARVERRRAYRDPDDRVFGGVAAGLADHFGLEPLQMRIVFVGLTALGGFGMLLYVAFWIFLPLRDPVAGLPPGVSAATRSGLRTVVRRVPGREVGLATSLAIIAVGGLVLVQNLGFGISSRVFWPLLTAAAGVGLLWWQSDEQERAEWLSTSSGWKGWARVLVGAGLLVGAVSLALFQAGATDALDDAIGAIVLALVGVGLVIGPWLLRSSRELRQERAERIRSQERADVAAHLHDSVLQTLALIQRQSSDPQAVVRLARTQERELRQWLYEASAPDADTLKAALQRMVTEVELAHEMPVELVIVGDVALDEGANAVVAATREAVVNGAKHSGADRVDVYAEVAPHAIEVFVRDRGIGFDVEQIPPDRLGVRRSLVDRMRRHGGEAHVKSSAGQGTEVALRMPRPIPQEAAR
jgi:signal transduction histidine kinase/phage shock protein PspC (stress-responsive transcriptional regulator)